MGDTKGKLYGETFAAEEFRLPSLTVPQAANTLDNARLCELEKRMRLELEKRDQERAEFVNSMVHEIKTPITAMLASCDLLSVELSGKPGILAELAENLTLSINNLNNRVSELMDFAKLQNMEMKVNLKTVDMKELIEKTGSLVSGLLQNRKQLLKCELDKSSGLVKADPDRVVQVLLNLLTNASNFGQPFKGIGLKTIRMDSYLVTEIEDTAEPISEEDRTLLFRPYRLASKKGNPGAGLGLYICKKLVELQGGKMWAEAGETGNRFMFSLPLASGEGGN
jgi:two-component system clock-associated histidine kinase SasA